MKVIGFGDSILKGAVLTDGPTLKYSLLQAGFLEQVCLAKGLDLVNHARFGSTISVGRSVFDRNSAATTATFPGRKSEPMQIIPKSLSRLWTDFFPDMPK